MEALEEPAPPGGEIGHLLGLLATVSQHLQAEAAAERDHGLVDCLAAGKAMHLRDELAVAQAPGMVTDR